jgi:hypothetical protein
MERSNVNTFLIVNEVIAGLVVGSNLLSASSMDSTTLVGVLMFIYFGVLCEVVRQRLNKKGE